MAKHAESRDRTHRLVLPVTEAEHAYARKAAGEAGFAGKARQVLREAGLLPPLQRGTRSAASIVAEIADKAKKGARGE